MSGWRREAELLERHRPHVWSRFEALAHALREQGRKRSSARQIMDVMRHEESFEVPNGDGPVLGRMLLDRHPEFAGWLEVRRSRLDRAELDAWWFA
jgi:hypothetical protein